MYGYADRCPAGATGVSSGDGNARDANRTLILPLGGCAAPGETVGPSGWNGAAYDDVVRAWGTPRAAKLTDGSNVYTWVSEGVGTRGVALDQGSASARAAGWA